MTAGAYAFVSGPAMVADFTGVVVDKFELGGAASHARYTGAASLVADDLAAAVESVEQLLGLPPVEQQRRSRRTDRATIQSIGEIPEAGELMPATSTGSYDVRDVDPGDLRRR